MIILPIYLLGAVIVMNVYTDARSLHKLDPSRPAFRIVS